MTISQLAQALTEQIRGIRNPNDPPVRLAFQLAIAAWLHGDHEDAQALRWGMFGTTVHAVYTELYPQAAEQSVEIDPAENTDTPQTRRAMAELVTAIADLLHACSHTQPDLSTAATQLRSAAADLT